MPCFKGFLCNVAFLFNSKGFNREHNLSVEDLVCDAFLHCGCRLVKFCLLLTSDEAHIITSEIRMIAWTVVMVTMECQTRRSCCLSYGVLLLKKPGACNASM